MVGTPGDLSPEQAEGRGGESIGPASDGLSRGCVLTFAATGRAPFGSGVVDALLYRAVHDLADLDGCQRGCSKCSATAWKRIPPDGRAGELVRELASGGAAQDEGASGTVPQGVDGDGDTLEIAPRNGNAATSQTAPRTEDAETSETSGAR